MTTVPSPVFPAVSSRDSLARYDCRIVHTRKAPLTHRFAYRTPMWLLDVDRVPVLPRGLRVAGRFDSRDHWSPGTGELRAGLDAFLAGQGVARPDRALLLTGARSFRHCFNPLSVWWCYDADGRQTHVVAEVHNTYHGRHAYLLTPDADGWDTVDKKFYVSPFFAAEGRYRMRITPPDDRLDIVIALELGDRVPFTAALQGRRHAAGRWALLGRPLAQLRVAALIRIQGIGLWLRRLPVRPRAGSPAIERAATGNLGVRDAS